MRTLGIRLVCALAAGPLLCACSARPRGLGLDMGPAPPETDAAPADDAGVAGLGPAVADACAEQGPGVYCGALLGLDPGTRYACFVGSSDARALVPGCAGGCASSTPPGNDACASVAPGLDAGSAEGGSIQTSAPVDVRAAPGDGWAEVKWSATAAPVTSFTVTAFPGPGSASVSRTATSARIDGLSNGTTYTFAVQADQGPPSGASNAVVPSAASNIIADVGYFHPVHHLTCEAASLRMALQHAGIVTDEPTILAAIPLDTRAGHVSGNTLTWGNPYTSFVGNLDGSEGNYTGYGTYSPTIAQAATSLGATVLQSGEKTAASAVYDAVLKGHPALVWVANDMTYHPPLMTWVAFDGTSLEWHGAVEHAFVVVGVTDDSIIRNDTEATSDWQWTKKTDFETTYATFDSMAVVIQ